MRRSHAALFSLVLLAFLGQAGMVARDSAFAQPATPVVTLDESIATLKELIAGVESGSQMVIAPLGANPYAGGMFTVEKDRVGTIGGWLVSTGQLDPDSVESWTRKQIELSRGALVVMKRELAAYEARRDGRPLPEDPSETPGPGHVDQSSVGMQGVFWPTPMDWREVGGIVRGTYRIQCYSGEERSPFTVRGTFLLELRGKGIILGSFTDAEDGVVEQINGTISEVGIAGGTAISTLAVTTWSAEFTREGNSIRIVDPEMKMDAGGDTRCDPGVVEQTS
jgi:hypothetical protein